MTKSNYPHSLSFIHQLFMISILCYFGYYYITNHTILFNTDIGLIFNFAERMLSGEILYKEVIEVNPPLIILYHASILLLAKMTGISHWSLFVIILLGFIILSATLIWKILRHIHYPKPIPQWILLIVIYIMSTAAYPSLFGQREHIFMIFFLPYIFMMIFSNQYTPPRKLRVAITLFAVLGLNIKPHFYIIFFAIESVYLFRHRNLHLLWRLESLIILSSGVVYVAFIYLFFHEYFDILPILLDGYARYNNSTITDTILIAMPFMGSLAILFTLIAIKEKSVWMTGMTAALWGGLLVFILQGKGWGYHFIPGLMLLELMVSMLILMYWKLKPLIQLILILLVLNLIPIIQKMTILPYLKPYIVYQQQQENKRIQLEKKLYSILHTLPDHCKVFFITMDTKLPSYYLKPSQQYVSRFILAWPYTVLNQNPSPQKAMAHLLTSIYEDLAKYQPDFLILLQKDTMRTYGIYDKLIHKSQHIRHYLEKNYILEKHTEFYILRKRKSYY